MDEMGQRLSTQASFTNWKARARTASTSQRSNLGENLDHLSDTTPISCSAFDSEISTQTKLAQIPIDCEINPPVEDGMIPSPQEQ